MNTTDTLAIVNAWTDARLDAMVASHPLLGRIERRQDFAGSHMAVQVTPEAKCGEYPARFLVTRSRGCGVAKWIEGTDPEPALRGAARYAVDQLMGSAIMGRGREGDLQGAPGELMGVSRWLPDRLSLTDVFYGIARSQERDAFAGIRMRAHDDEYNPSKAIERVWAHQEKRLGHGYHYPRPTLLLVSESRKEAAGQLVVRPNESRGVVDVAPCPGVPDDCAFLIAPETWQLMSCCASPHLQKSDGIAVIRGRGRDIGWLFARFAWYAQLVCLAPFFNARIALAEHKHRWHMTDGDDVECACGETRAGAALSCSDEMRREVQASMVGKYA